MSDIINDYQYMIIEKWSYLVSENGVKQILKKKCMWNSEELGKHKTQVITFYFTFLH